MGHSASGWKNFQHARCGYPTFRHRILKLNLLFFNFFVEQRSFVGIFMFIFTKVSHKSTAYYRHKHFIKIIGTTVMMILVSDSCKILQGDQKVMRHFLTRLQPPCIGIFHQDFTLNC